MTPLYRFAIWMRNRKFDRALAAGKQNVVRRSILPVISVGNLTTGGTGKTPHVIAIARMLRENNQRVAVVSRGYGAQKGARNDEAMEMEIRLPDVPHLQDPDRYAMTQIAAEELESEVVLLDDGFQHRQLARDLDIVIVDATNPFGYDRLLPRGLLREPVSSLRRADWVIISRCELVDSDRLEAIESAVLKYVDADRILKTRMELTQAINSQEKSISVGTLLGKPTLAICGIGNPDNFYQSLRDLGVELAGTRAFPDHHHFEREDLHQIGELAKVHNAEQILCTHKDLVKLGVDQLGGLPLFAVLIDVEFQTEISRFESSLIEVARSANA